MVYIEYPPANLFDVCFVGHISGKTCLIHRYFDDKFDNETYATLGACFQNGFLELENMPVKIRFTDTGSSEGYHSLICHFIRNFIGFVIVYEITDRYSFEKAKYWMEKIILFAPDYSCLMVLGNKCDLEDMREVSREEGEEFAFEYGALFFETSAKDNINVNESMMALASEMIKKKDEWSFDSYQNPILKTPKRKQVSGEDEVSLGYKKQITYSKLKQRDEKRKEVEHIKRILSKIKEEEENEEEAK